MSPRCSSAARSALSVTRRSKSFFSGQHHRPVVRLEHRRVQVVVNLLKDGHESLFVNRLVFVRQRLAGPQLFEHVIHARHRQLRM
jgi:hypothetical protein